MRKATTSSTGFGFGVFAVARLVAVAAVMLPGPRAFAQDADVVARVVAAIERALPPGWAMDEPPANAVFAAGGDLPSGHWDCRDYNGPRGTMVEAVGPTPIEVEWETESGEAGSTPVTWESVKIWVMPPDYKKDFALLSTVLGFAGLLCERSDDKPQALLHGPEVIVYGLPSILYRKDPVYDEIFRKATKKLVFASAPDVDPSRLSWTSWKSDLEAELRSEFPD